MLGAIAGDVIGSVFEGKNYKAKDFQLFTARSRFTDDTVLTVATADVLLNQNDYAQQYKEYYHRYPRAGFGKGFMIWAMHDRPQPYNSWGNGSAMRVSPIWYAFNDLETVLQVAKQSAEVTHNHPEGIKGAQATATAILMARTGQSKQAIKTYIESTFGYDLNRTLDEIRPTYQFDVSCQGSVPPAIIAFLESTDFEDTIRNAISIGGDSDTIACIAGGIAQAFYGGVPEHISQEVLKRLDQPLRQITESFMAQYCSN